MAKAATTSFDAMLGSTPDTETTDLATQDDNRGPMRAYSATPDFDQEDMTYPRLRLAQGLTQEVTDGVAQSGDWVLAGFEPEKAVVIIPVMAAKAREARDSEDNKVILCQSPDAKVGFGNPGGDCASCKLAQWRPNPRDATKNLPPACSVVYSYVAWSVTHDTLVSIDFRRSGTQVAKFLNTMINSRGLGKFAVTLTSKNQKGARGTYAVAGVMLARVDEEQLETARASVEQAAV